MKTKLNDTPYCGVNQFKIHGANPTVNNTNLRILYNYIQRRYQIHLRKDVLKLSAPWTSDTILAEYRFTNVRREHDRETRWLIEHITSNKKLSYTDKIYNCVLFRLYNKHQTAELLGLPIKFSDGNFDPENYDGVWQDALDEDPKRVFFTGAFLTSGMKRVFSQYVPEDLGGDISEMRPLWFMKHLTEQNFAGRLSFCADQREAYEQIAAYNGIGRFLAYQIFVDFTYIEDFPYSENEFTVAGIGCKRGINYLFTNRDHLNYEECLFWLRDNLEDLFAKHLGKDFDPKTLFWDLPEEDRYMNIMSLENCMCELSKYLKLMNGTGRPRKKYVPSEEDL